MAKKEHTVTDAQKLCAEEYVNNGFNIEAAIKVGYPDSHHIVPQLKKKLVNSANFMKYMASLVEKRDNLIPVDKLYVINKLKEIVDTGSNMEKVKALSLIGKYLQMFTDRQIIESSENDPASIASNVFKERMATMKNGGKIGDVIEFKKDGTDD